MICILRIGIIRLPASRRPPHHESVLAQDALMDGQRRLLLVLDPSVVQHRRHTDGLLLVPVPPDRVFQDVILLGLRPPHGQFQLGLLDHRTELPKLILLLLGPTVAQLAEPPLLGPFATSIRSSSTFGLHRLQEVHHHQDLLLLLQGPEEFGALGEQLGHGLHMSHRSNWRACAVQTKRIRKPRSATMQDGYAWIFLELRYNEVIRFCLTHYQRTQCTLERNLKIPMLILLGEQMCKRTTRSHISHAK